MWTVGAQIQFCYLNNSSSTNIFPALVLTNLSSFDNTTKEIVLNNCYLKFGENYVKVSFLPSPNLYEVVFPRIRIESSALKISEDQLALTIGDTPLNNYEDYYVMSEIGESLSNNSEKLLYYDITVKPVVLAAFLSFYSSNINSVYGYEKLSIFFNLSNTDTAIFNDAKDVLKENSIPQVSYELNYNIFKSNDYSIEDALTDISLASFARLGHYEEGQPYITAPSHYLNHIVNINDYELKFVDVRGYISGLTLTLDRPWEDTIEIKNYRSKFEDLFSSIVAQTEEMKKSGYILDTATKVFDTNGQIKGNAIQQTLFNEDLNYAFNNGNLTIDEQNGIW